MFLVFDFKVYNFKSALEECLAASKKLSDTTIIDLDETEKFCEEQTKSNKL